MDDRREDAGHDGDRDGDRRLGADPTAPMMEKT